MTSRQDTRLESTAFRTTSLRTCECAPCGCAGDLDRAPLSNSFAGLRDCARLGGRGRHHLLQQSLA